jgi:hypothetical protein
MEEPSVLDYLKEKLNPRHWGKPSEVLPDEGEAGKPLQQKPLEPAAEPARARHGLSWAWRVLLALVLAFFAQSLLEPTSYNLTGSLVFYAAALSALMLAVRADELKIVAPAPAEAIKDEHGIRILPLYLFVFVTLLAFYELKDNQFTAFNVTLWLAALVLGLITFWRPQQPFDLRTQLQQGINYLKKPFINFHLTSWQLLCIAVLALAAFFHFYHLSTVPLEMTSDHAEKLLDVNDVLHGKFSMFFPRNGGREPIQFYLAAALIKWFGASLGFTTLKLSMALAFMVGLIFVYLLGKEFGNRWTGLLGMLLTTFAAWTNIIARVGLRLILCPVFVAIDLYFLFRAIRRGSRNDFILTGIFLGLGLLGYSAFRIMPVVVVLAILIYVLHERERARRKLAWQGLGLIVAFSFVLAMPLLHFALQYPEAFGYRTLTRMTSTEVALPVNLVSTFFSNTWNAITMPFFRDGSTWVISVTDRPALDIITAALYLIGLVVVLIRWIKTRNWQDLFFLAAIPVLMLPSILALAFPNENPSLSRAGGAVIPILLIAAIGFQSILTSIWQKTRSGLGKGLTVLLALLIVTLSAAQNYDLVFNQYNTSYANATWNTKEMGEVCHDFIDSVGAPDTCYVVGVAYWVDTRLVAMVAGYPTMDYAIWPKDVPATKDDPRAKMFILKADQPDAISQVEAIYPNGFATLHSSAIPGRDFIAYFVPPTTVGQ